jgi:hypothetical protein
MANQGEPHVPDPTSRTTGSRTASAWTTAVGAGLFLWFLFAWLILDRHILDAAGESVGTAFALGVVVSLIGALRGSR